MTVDHLLLGGMQNIATGQSFDGDQMFPVQLPNGHDAGIDRVVTHPLVGLLAHHHGTGAAVTGGTAFLGTGQTLRPDIGQHGCICGLIEDKHLLIDLDFQILTIWTGIADNLA